MESVSANQNDAHRYDDIIRLPHHVSDVHPQMSRMNRAAQFSPFAALTGYEEAVRETERLTEEKIELDESQKAVLEERVQRLLAMKDKKPEVSVTWFQPDARKAGGEYVTHSGCLLGYNGQDRVLVMEDGTRIPVNDLYSVEGEALFSMDEG